MAPNRNEKPCQWKVVKRDIPSLKMMSRSVRRPVLPSMIALYSVRQNIIQSKNISPPHAIARPLWGEVVSCGSTSGLWKTYDAPCNQGLRWNCIRVAKNAKILTLHWKGRCCTLHLSVERVLCRFAQGQTTAWILASVSRDAETIKPTYTSNPDYDSRDSPHDPFECFTPFIQSVRPNHEQYCKPANI